MGELYRNSVRSLADTSEVLLYTCPAFTKAVINSAVVTNKDAIARSVRLKVTDSSAGQTAFLAYDQSIQPASQSEPPSLIRFPVVLEEGDTLVIKAGTANVFDVALNLVEVSSQIADEDAGAFLSWHHTGVTNQTVFSISGASVASARAYVVTVNGVTVESDEYTIDAAADTLTFAVAPSNGADIEIRCLAYTRSVLNALQIGNNLSDLASVSAARANLGLVIGTDVAPVASPTFSGVPTAPTAPFGTNTTQLATTAFVQAEVSALINSAPGALDTLNELAAALNNDANFATTVTNSLASKLSLSGGTMTGPLTLHSSSLLKWGNTASFPALKRSSTELQVRLADDSGYAPFRAGAVYAEGGVTTGFANGITVGYGVVSINGGQFIFDLYGSYDLRIGGSARLQWTPGGNWFGYQDAELGRAGVGTLGIWNKDNLGCALKVHGTYTDGSNFVRASLAATSTSVTLAAETAGTGADNVDVNITPAGTGSVAIIGGIVLNGAELSEQVIRAKSVGITSPSLAARLTLGIDGGYPNMQAGDAKLIGGYQEAPWGASRAGGAWLIGGPSTSPVPGGNAYAQGGFSKHTGHAAGSVILRTGTASSGTPGEIQFWVGTATGLNENSPWAGTQMGAVKSSGWVLSNLVAFVDTTSSYPALKRNGTELQVRLADDSGYANIRAANLITQGEIQTDNVNLYIRNAGSSTLILGADVLVYQRFLSFGSGGANYADCSIGREAAGVLALRNDHYYAGFVSHTLRIYGARTDDSNYVRASLAATSTAVTLSAETAGTGADNVDVNITPAGTGSVKLATHASLYLSGTGGVLFEGGGGKLSSIVAQAALVWEPIFETRWSRLYGFAEIHLEGRPIGATPLIKFTQYATANDLGIARNTAGVLEINNGTLGTYRDLKLRTAYLTSGLDFASGYCTITAYGGGLSISNGVYLPRLTFDANSELTSTGGALTFRHYSNPASLQLYGAYTDGSNYVRASLAATSTSVTLAAETAGTGADNVDVNITPAGTGQTVVTNLYAHRDFSTAYSNGKMLQVTAVDGRTVTFGSFMGYPAISFGDNLTTNFASNGKIYGQSGGLELVGGAGSGPIRFYGQLEQAYPATFFVANGGGVITRNYLAICDSSAAATDGADVVLRRDAANTLALRNGSNGQKLRVYGDYTGASQYCALEMSCAQAGGDYFSHYIGPVNAGAGDYWNDNRGKIGGWSFLTIEALSSPSGDAGAIEVHTGMLAIRDMTLGGYLAFFDGRSYTSTGQYGHRNYLLNPNTASHTLGLWQASGHTKSALTVYTNSVLKADITSAGAFRSYGAWTDDSNYVRASLSAAASSVTLAAQTAGTGADDVDVSINPAGAGRVYFLSNGLQLDSYGTGVRLFGVSYIQNNSAPIRILCGAYDGIAVLDTGGVTIDNPVSPDTVATLKLNARGTQLAPLFNAGGFTVNSTGTFVTFGHQNSASYPALKRSSTELQVRLADDSGYAGINAASYTFSGGASLSFNGSEISSFHRLLSYTGLVSEGYLAIGPWPNYTYLYAAGADIFEQRRTTNAQTLRVYGTYTDGSNFVRASLAATSTSVTLAAQTAGTGADDVGIDITSAGNGNIVLKVGGTARATFTASAITLGSDHFVGNGAGYWRFSEGDGYIYYSLGGQPYLRFGADVIKQSANGAFAWASSNASLGATDLAISRNAAGIAEINNGTPGTYRDIKARNFYFGDSAYFIFNGSRTYSSHNLVAPAIVVGSVEPIDVILERDASAILALRNSTNAQTFRVYGTYTDASNYVRASLAATSTAVTLSAETAGTGADNIDINITPAGTGTVVFSSAIQTPGGGYIGTLYNLPYFAVSGSGEYFSLRSGMRASSGFSLDWGSAANAYYSTDVSIRRNAAGVVEVNNGTPGTYRDMRLRTITVDAVDGNGLQFNGGGSVEAYSNYLTLTSPYTGFAFYSPQVGANVLTTDNTTLDIALHTRIASNKAIYFTSGGEISAASNVLNIKAYTSFVLSTTGGSTRRVAEISNTGELYGFYSYTDGSNYQGYKLTSGATSVTLSAETAGTGADDINLILSPAGSGKVGIGTASPTQLLSVGSVFKVSSAGAVTIKTGGTGLGGTQGLVADDGTGIALEDGTLRLEQSGAACRTALRNGAIFLGTGLVDSLQYSDSTNQFWLSKPLSFAESNAPIAVYDMIRWGDGTSSNFNNPTYVAVSAVKTTANEYGLTFNVSTAATKSERMRLSPTGFLGIGTTSPTAYLDLPASTTSAASLRIRTGTAPTSPNSGDVWHDSTQKTLSYYAAGVAQTVNGVLFTQTQTVTVSDTVTETALTGTGTGTLTLPANFFAAGKTIKIRALGYHSSTASPNITIRIKLGSTTILTTGAILSGNGSDDAWVCDAVFTCRTTGGTGTIIGQGYYEEVHGNGNRGGMVNTATTTIDTTASQAISITVEWETADAGNTISCTNVLIEVLN